MKRRMEHRDALEVDVTENGFLTITQEDHPQDTEARVVYLEPTQVPVLIEWLNELLPEVEQAWTMQHQTEVRKGAGTS